MRYQHRGPLPRCYSEGVVWESSRPVFRLRDALLVAAVFWGGMLVFALVTPK